MTQPLRLLIAKRAGWLIAVALVCGAFALKALGLIDATSLWSDELYTVGKSFQPRFGSLLAMLREDTHPLLYYSLLWLWGAGSGLIADRRSNLVYSREELLRRLNYPLHLSLPAAPWSASAVEVLVGQLSTLLDHNLSWRVLSIARQHEAVEPLTQLLQQQGGTELQCSSADPLLTAVLRTESSDRPTGLLLVVEPGFNSARALEEARLLIS